MHTCGRSNMRSEDGAEARRSKQTADKGTTETQKQEDSRDTETRGHQRHRAMPPARAPEDEHVGTFLEALFDFVSEHLTRFSAPACPIPSLAPPICEDEGLAALPRAELQETLVELAHIVGR